MPPSPPKENMADALTHEEQNLAKVNNFKVAFAEIPTLQFHVKAADIPGLSLPSAKVTTPYADVNVPGNKLEYDDLGFEFLINEDLSNWTAIHNWMRGLASVESIGDSTDLLDSLLGENEKSTDISVIALNNSGKEVLEYTFINATPNFLSQVNFRNDAIESENLTANCTFTYDYYTLRRSDV